VRFGPRSRTWWSIEVTRERFQELAEAYGGDIARWPASVRDEAALVVAGDAEFARGVLAQADALDAVLFALPAQAASSALVERTVADAPPLRTRRLRWREWLAPAGLSVGLAAATAAGVILGVQLSGHATTSGVAATDQSLARAVAEFDVSGLSENV
jgi:hypothetical protein